MLKMIKNLFTSKKTLRNELDKTLMMLDECQAKVLERQEQINKTNAYYKKKLYEMKKNKPTKKGL